MISVLFDQLSSQIDSNAGHIIVLTISSCVSLLTVMCISSSSSLVWFLTSSIASFICSNNSFHHSNLASFIFSFSIFTFLKNKLCNSVITNNSKKSSLFFKSIPKIYLRAPINKFVWCGGEDPSLKIYLVWRRRVV